MSAFIHPSTIVVVTFFLLLMSPCRALGDSLSGTTFLYEDESSTSALSYIQEVAEGGVNGTTGLQLVPDRWHRPVYTLYCDGNDREDFSPYDTLEFYFRSTDVDPGDPSFYVKNWEEYSNTVLISDYIDGGQIDSEWRLVSIPISDLQTDTWDLGNVERLNWNKDELGRTYYLDEITLNIITPPALITSGTGAPFPESSRVLRLTFSKNYSHDSAKTLSNYSIQSDGDSFYTDSQNPEDVGIHYRLEDISDSKTATNCYQVFLELPSSLQNGCEYILNITNVADTAGNVMEPTSYSFTYDDTQLTNHNVKVNQIGYLPQRPKIGYVGGYLGDLGGGAWAVGDNGAIYSWNDRKGWGQDISPTLSTLHAVVATREDSAWAVGEGGTILYWDGTDWMQTSSPTTNTLFSIAFSPENIGWAVGANGIILHLSDGEWCETNSPSAQTLRSVWAGPNDTAWAVGDSGTILEWDGNQWAVDEQPTDENLYALGGPHDDWLWACGEDGEVLLHIYGHWYEYEEFPETSETLRAITSDETGAIWIGGDNGLLWKKAQFGSSSFVAVTSNTENVIYSLSRQHGRQLWGAGSSGALISQTTNDWESCALAGDETLYGIFALPYGALRLPDPLTQVSAYDIDTGEIVLTASLTLKAANYFLSGEDLYCFDFSDLKTPGNYQVYVPGLGVSDPFVISEGVFDNAAYTTARGLYYQRSGMALETPFAEECFARPLSHGSSTDAAYHSSLSNSVFFTENEIAGNMIDAHGGWHDAGDYGKYIPTAAAALWFLFTSYDMDPAKFVDDALNIPESGNGIPDLLDEVQWEIDWMMRMQAEDGSVYHKLTAESWFAGMPAEETDPRYLFERTTHDTALAAAVFAAASRLFEPFDTDAAQEYLERAELAWSFLSLYPDATPSDGFENPDGVATGEYNDSDDSDNRLWAAAELYRTTGDAEYKDYFEGWAATNSLTMGWNNWQHFYQCAYWAYLQADHSDVDSDIQTAISTKFLTTADTLVTRTIENPYYNAARLDVPDWIGWGEFTQSTEYSFSLLQAWSISGETNYLDAATLNLDAQLGANPLAFSFITGLGARYPQDPLQKVSMYDGVDEPVPGIPVFGPAAHLSNGQTYYVLAQSDENSYPQSYSTTDPYPILRRYVDTNELVPMSEFTIVDMAIAAGVFHLLAE
jgi:photosystem II stability/assembly factor-like uncharacterized protein